MATTAAPPRPLQTEVAVKVLNGMGYEEELTLSNPLLAGLLAVSGMPGVLTLCTLRMSHC